MCKYIKLLLNRVIGKLISVYLQNQIVRGYDYRTKKKN